MNILHAREKKGNDGKGGKTRYHVCQGREERLIAGGERGMSDKRKRGEETRVK